MAVKLVANYSKRLGLPGYSSHQFSVSVETELVTTDDVAGESQRLYELLQTSVDEQIQSTGFVPGATYGMAGDSPGDAATHSATVPSTRVDTPGMTGSHSSSAMSAVICATVLIFPMNATATLRERPSCAIHPRNAEIAISRPMMMIAR